MSKYKEKLKNEKESYSTGKLKQTGRATLFKKGKLKPRMVSPSDMILRKKRKPKAKKLMKVEKFMVGGVATGAAKLAKTAAKIRKERLKKSAEEAKKVRKKGKDYDKKIKKNIVKDISKGKKPAPAGPMPGQPKKPMSKNKKLGALTESVKKKRRDARVKRMEGAGPLGLKKPKDEIPLKFGLGGAVKKISSSLINKYKPKIKNEKEVYSGVKQDYADVIKKAEKTQKRKRRNRKAAGAIGGVTAATVVASNVKDKK